ncbi:MAG: cysteine peptidase family C39 domain-containing protein [Prevotella sp.]
MKFFKRFPHFRQNNSSDCGPTSLRMIARHYGLDYSTEMLRKHCHITRHGINLLGISEAAEYIGFETAGLKVTFEQLAEEGVFPCILHWNQNHFVVCYGRDARKSVKNNLTI